MSELHNIPGFLAREGATASEAEALFHVIPCPMEKHISYKGGTANGPAAILTASQELEANYKGREICRSGIHTTKNVDCSGSAEDVLSQLTEMCCNTYKSGAIPIVLGGEHTVTWGALRAVKTLNKSVGVVQLDAHADLRNTYEDTPYSHACVMHRVFEMGFPFVQFGVRSLSSEEIAFRKEHSVCAYDAERLVRCGVPELPLPDDFPENIYITVDIDVCDPSLVPATGTPEPGGLDWYTVCDIIEASARGRQIIGGDIVELSPVEGYHASDFIAAKLAYHLMYAVMKSKE